MNSIANPNQVNVTFGPPSECGCEAKNWRPQKLLGELLWPPQAVSECVAHILKKVWSVFVEWAVSRRKRARNRFSFAYTRLTLNAFWSGNYVIVSIFAFRLDLILKARFTAPVHHFISYGLCISSSFNFLPSLWKRGISIRKKSAERYTLHCPQIPCFRAMPWWCWLANRHLSLSSAITAGKVVKYCIHFFHSIAMSRVRWR